MAEPAQQGLCDDCATPLVGRFCHVCGEDNAPPRREMKALVADFFDNIFSFTEHVLPTLRDLAVDPGRILRGLRDGDTKRYLSPFKLYVSATVVFFLFLAVSGVSFFQMKVERTGGPIRVEYSEGTIVGVEGFRMEERFLHPSWAAPRDEAVVAALDEAQGTITDETAKAVTAFLRLAAAAPSELTDTISTWAPRVLWLLMPLYALLLWPLYRRGTLVADHFIFALWAHTSLFLLLIVGALWNFTGLGWGLLLALGLYQIYLTIGLKGYFGRSWPGAVAKGLVHSGVYFGLIWLPLTAAFFLWQVMRHMPPGYFVE